VLCYEILRPIQLIIGFVPLLIEADYCIISYNIIAMMSTEWSQSINWPISDGAFLRCLTYIWTFEPRVYAKHVQIQYNLHMNTINCLLSNAEIEHKSRSIGQLILFVLKFVNESYPYIIWYWVCLVI